MVPSTVPSPTGTAIPAATAGPIRYDYNPEDNTVMPEGPVVPFGFGLQPVAAPTRTPEAQLGAAPGQGDQVRGITQNAEAGAGEAATTGDQNGGLAHSGSTTRYVGYFGLSLLGYGAYFLGAGRRMRGRADNE